MMGYEGVTTHGIKAGAIIDQKEPSPNPKPNPNLTLTLTLTLIMQEAGANDTDLVTWVGNSLGSMHRYNRPNTNILLAASDTLSGERKKTAEMNKLDAIEAGQQRLLIDTDPKHNL